MSNHVTEFPKGVLVSLAFAGAMLFALGNILSIIHDAANTEAPAACPVPPESTTVCGYVEREHKNHAGLRLRITGCGPYDG